jgi:hypothetical protein
VSGLEQIAVVRLKCLIARSDKPDGIATNDDFGGVDPGNAQWLFASQVDFADPLWDMQMDFL